MPTNMRQIVAVVYIVTLSSVTSVGVADTPPRQTQVEIANDAFHINGRPTYENREWNGHRIEGLLMNARLVQGIFDDLNSETRERWAYPDTGEWDPDRNTNEFIAAMDDWRAHGLLAFTINLQGGSPEGYSQEQPWHNSAFHADGSLRPAYMDRLERVLDRADELGMVPIVGFFYFGQDQRLEDEQAVRTAVRNATEWILERGYTNVLIEVNNEANLHDLYEHEILHAPNVHELIELVQSIENDGRSLLAGTSFSGGALPTENVVAASDFILIHGNGVDDPDRIAEMAHRSREMTIEAHGHPIPVLFNEDDHYDFDEDWNNCIAAVSEYASWGYFDYRRSGEDFDEGYQSVPVNWQINSDRKQAFFNLVAEITGHEPEGE